MQRAINPLTNQSFFILGARGTGKTHYLNERYDNDKCLRIDLLREKEFLALSRRPELLEERIAGFGDETPEWIVIDEVQRIPSLLNEVHSLLENKRYRGKIKFILTGSSARKLKAKGVNLLAGRALINYMFPLTHHEIGETFSLISSLQWGTLPRVVLGSSDIERREFLDAYVTTYIKEEIRVEQAVRNLDPFLRFVEVAAQSSGELVNYSLIGRQCHVEPRVVQRYFQILEDTLIGFFLEPFHRSIRKRQIERPKFFFFDLGVASALAGTLDILPIPQTSLYGKRFEQFIILELYRLGMYCRKHWKLFFYSTHDGAEIDLVIERSNKEIVAVEIKSSREVSTVELNKLCVSGKAIGATDLVVLCMEGVERKFGDISVFPWMEGIQWLLNSTSK
jgi:predicted AAA+ superfamily ATPase